MLARACPGRGDLYRNPLGGFVFMPTDPDMTGRDPQGLIPRKKDGPDGDEALAAAAYKNYMPMIFGLVPLVQLALAAGTYFLLGLLGYGSKLGPFRRSNSGPEHPRRCFINVA
jgi:hypothetical protein